MLGAPAATGDDLSNAIAQQKALQAKIAAQKKQVQALTLQQAAVSATISTASKTLNGINANMADVKKQMATAAANVALVKASYQDLANQLAAIDTQLVVLQNDENRRELALIQRKELLAERLRAAYATGNTSLLEIILTSPSFNDILSEVSSYLDVGEQDQVLAAQIAQGVRDVAAVHQAVLAVRADTAELRGLVLEQKKLLDTQLAVLKAQQARVKALQDEAKRHLTIQQNAYNKLASNKKALAAAIARASSARASLLAKIDRLRAARSSEGRVPSVYNGTLAWPMVGQVTQEYGCTGVVVEPPLGNCRHFHQGIDIVAPYGAAIRASGAGTVLYVGWNYADGYDPAWIVIVAHSAGLETWYAHMQPLFPVRAGDSVSAGQVVGYEGNTGHSTGAHLHWAVRFNGSFVNPRLFL
jgi:murein DD-endopeptidase MepM/ murein hydrolase activator NlpD